MASCETLQIYEKWSTLEVTRKALDINKIVIRGVPILTPPRMFILLYFIKLRVTSNGQEGSLAKFD